MSDDQDTTDGTFPFASGPLDPRIVEQLMASLPPEIQQMIGPIEEAIQGDDPQAALEKLRTHPAFAKGISNPEAMRASLNKAIEPLAGLAGELEGKLQALGPMMLALEQAHETMVQGASELLSFEKEDEENLAELLESFSKGLKPGHLASTLKNTQILARSVHEVLGDLQTRDPRRVHAVVRSWKSDLNRLESSVGTVEEQTRQTELFMAHLSRWASIGRDQRHANAAELLVLKAAFAETLALMGGVGEDKLPTEDWATALDCALEFENLSSARKAAAALQLIAARRGEPARIAELAARVGALAESIDAPRELVLCKTEEALAYAHSEMFEAAQATANHALETAEKTADAGLCARARMTLGQVLELSQDRESAIRHYVDLRADLEGQDGLHSFLGRCCLALGRLWSDQEGIEPLERARDIGMEIRDPVVLVPASLGLASRLGSLGRYDEAIAELIKGRARCAALAGEATAKAFDQKAEEFEGAWGTPQFQASLRVFQSNMP